MNLSLVRSSEPRENPQVTWTSPGNAAQYARAQVKSITEKSDLYIWRLTRTENIFSYMKTLSPSLRRLEPIRWQQKDMESGWAT